MQVFTPAKTIRAVKTEVKQEYSPEPVKQERPRDISWKSFYKHAPTVLDVSAQRHGARGAMQGVVERKADINHKDIKDLLSARVKVLQHIHHVINDRKTDERRAAGRLSQEEEVLMQWNTQHALTASDSGDAISFYLCALGFSHSPEAWEWFRRMEETLMRARVLGLRQAEREELYVQHGVYIDSLDPRKTLAKRDQTADEVDLCRSLLFMENRYSAKPRASAGAPQSPSDILMATDAFTIESTSASTWYRTKLSLALDAVRKRDVILRDGFAYVQAPHLANALLSNFRKRLETFHGAASDQRVHLSSTIYSYAMRLIDTVCNVEEVPRTDTHREMHQIMGSVKPQDIDYLAEHHFPPCMQQLNEQLNRDRHLKYHGRWQYGLFLKKIGLNLEDALDFFGRKESMGPEAYRKSRYGYSTRHYYGQEGKHTDYSSLGCASIISGAPPTASSCHGCPFKHEETAALKQMVSSQCPSATDADIEEIVAAREGHHYSRACFHYFKLNRPAYTGENLFNSPFEFYSASTAAVKAEKTEKSES